ncbi:ATP-binding mismatch repair protein [Fusarium piperis]|uniref:DNA mismatch repair protein PMS1 n=1 Tax=Fusarium piperis TaxID=1435070 RepID=A0A9W8W7K4_9HYPO|nr:ATP-binding mismatch repair protein [Fusarium piperis]
MTTIKQIDGRTVHQIQSGQVIVDLCSVVKELVENSVDAGATSIDVRFKNQGLDLIEVADNGSGIAPANYPSVALKHHTSKLSSYSDISTLQTFGFRGEALASLCALSVLTMTTCQAGEAPKGSKLSFEPSGKLSGTTVVAASKGTTVSVERLFHNLPVRRRELERNIKREWNKVISLLNQYACIQTNLKFSVSQQPTKGKRMQLFSTKGNPTTRDNIINIFGAKTMTVLVPLDLKLEMQPSKVSPALQLDVKDSATSKEVRIVGHVSRPSHGDGRQTPDRQMFFVNGRPCGLPQFAKAFNEVYRSYNASQSPFILADIQLDTHMYDVNVSPDKRSILLHDQNELLDNLCTSLTDLFDSQNYSVPTAQLLTPKPNPEKQTNRATPAGSLSQPRSKPHSGPQDDSGSEDEVGEHESPVVRVQIGQARTIRASRSLSKDTSGQNLISGWVERKATSRTDKPSNTAATYRTQGRSDSKASTSKEEPSLFLESSSDSSESDENDVDKPLPVRDFNKRLKEKTVTISKPPIETISSPPPVEDEPQIPAVQPLRRGQDDHRHISPIRSTQRGAVPEVTTVIIGNERVQDPSSPLPGVDKREASEAGEMEIDEPKPSFGNRLTQIFAAGSEAATDQRVPLQDGSDDESVDDSRSGPDPDPDDDGDGIRGREAPKLSDVPSDHEEDPRSADPSSIEETDDQPQNPSLTSPLAPMSNQVLTAEQKSQPLKAGVRKRDATSQILQHLRTNEGLIRSQMASWAGHLPVDNGHSPGGGEVTDLGAADAEEKLSLTIARKDFLKMRVAGQFNLGFIIAVRPAQARSDDELELSEHDELFIVDQHATDEKYNFERLQQAQTVQSQRLVHPKRLELTALEEEIVMQNMSAIEANGFKVHVDMSGDEPVGSRCEVLALPMSREVTFTLTDFEELIALLGEESSESKHVPRPSKVRKMFASRACRSSVMIGKPLTQGQMETLVRHMAELDKPWNCPHGRPTMRHLCQLDSWDGRGWKADQAPVSWRSYVDE